MSNYSGSTPARGFLREVETSWRNFPPSLQHHGQRLWKKLARNNSTEGSKRFPLRLKKSQKYPRLNAIVSTRAVTRMYPFRFFVAPNTNILFYRPDTIRQPATSHKTRKRECYVIVCNVARVTNPMNIASRRTSQPWNRRSNFRRGEATGLGRIIRPGIRMRLNSNYTVNRPD